MGKGLLDIEAPTALESIGRGYMDVYEPFRQGWEYWRNGPEGGRQYRDQRQSEEALYKRGLANQPGNVIAFDPWRVVGRAAVAAPFLGGAGSALSGLQTNMAWESFDSLRRAYDLYKRGLLGPK